MSMAGGDEGLRALQRVQLRRKLALLMAFGIAVPALAFVNSYWREPWPTFYVSIEWVGIALILVCIAGRTWCTAYIGGRKKRELVTTGPYSIVRNPLYVFTLIGAVGVGLQFGSLIVAAIVTCGRIPRVPSRYHARGGVLSSVVSAGFCIVFSAR